MKYSIYGRVSPKGSTWAGSETSIPDQVRECQSFVFARDQAATFEIVTDEFQSAGSANRPGYKRIIDALTDGTADWDVLVVRHIDRLNRSLTDAIKILQLLQANGKGLISTTQQLDMSTPTGRAMLHIILIFAQWEREMGSERTKMKMLSIVQAGGWPVGKVPVGYIRPGKGNNALEIDARGAEMVAGIFAAYAAGVQPIEIIRTYGLQNRQRLYGILRNKIYRGLIEYDGELYKGKHEAIVDKDTWATVQGMIGPKKSPVRMNARKRHYILSGLVRCTCGRYMTPASAHGRNKTYHYYQCTDALACKKRINADDIEPIVLERLAGIDIQDAEIQTMKKMAKSYFRMISPTVGEIDRVKDAIVQAKAALDAVKRLFLSGIVTQENAGVFNAELTQRTAELNRLEGRHDALMAISNKDTSELFKVDHVIDGFKNLKDGLLAADDAQTKQQIVGLFVKTICCNEDGSFTVELKDGSSTSHDWPAREDLVEPARVLMVIRKDGTDWMIS